MADVTGLQIAAQRKRADTIARATTAVSEMAAEGAEITFQQVARRAGVSRQWLYGQPALRAQIEDLRDRPRRGVPARERSSEASLHQRLRTLADENRGLREENRDLKHELAIVYGTQRAPASPSVPTIE
ncbi:DUF6262 family protein [Paraconexibacter antarcticus]|uniref:DUF6262 family protein n=1 Tax=Paraconexibacter antarcticus TaxID=2949664 RepID=A0ABY5DR32_9ACTN|nr:DUF6262 family protein [Paraconexibacter antarcticus]UTI63910.1 DUF6262 family protein [Paraconexibacter antarcticus]